MKKQEKSKEKKELSLIVSGSGNIWDISENFEEINEIVENLKKKDSAKNKKRRKDLDEKKKKDERKPDEDTEEDDKIREKDEESLTENRDASYAESIIYQQQMVDYEKLFSYIGKKPEETYSSESQQFYKETEASAASDISEEELEHIVKKEQTDIMLCKDMDRIDIEEKEKYKNWKTFNTFWNMIKIQLNKVGEGATGVFYV